VRTYSVGSVGHQPIRAVRPLSMVQSPPLPSHGAPSGGVTSDAVGIVMGVPVADSGRTATGVPVAMPTSAGDRPVARRAEWGVDGPVMVHLPPCPPGAPPDGRYSNVGFFGPQSAFCCLIMCVLAPPLSCVVPCFPCDRNLVYLAPDGSVWDPESGVEMRRM
jgi:hypothetical protein